MAFIFKVQTVGTDDTFTLPLISGGTYDCVVDWGDGGPTSAITTYDDPDRIHTYTTEDLYTISVTGTLYGWQFNNAGDCAMMRDVTDWGAGVFRPDNFPMGATTGHFYGCANMTSSAGNAPDITGTISLQDSFRNCLSLVSLDLAGWDVSGVTNFSTCWHSCSSLTTLGDLSNWDVSGVTTFSTCWHSCSSLTTLGDLSNWDVSSVTTFSTCWHGCSSLTTLGDLSNWDVSSVTTFSSCWYDCPALSNEIYSKMLVAWSRLSLQAGTDAHFGTAKYLKGASTDARALIDAVWGTITDGGQHYAKYPSQPDYIKSIIVPRNINWRKKYIPDMWGWAYVEAVRHRGFIRRRRR